ncbi:hypothetical protein [Salidesulfovibrio onnuriiensis]|uniref:hypothetical protein n=1 Tax=Salidesulfovibrio onnuriiensis TaxID=2583823 RepID=UPI0011CCAC34|nr:hypothetical protein [Salidesulfovibrio onnuriiensis]
MKFGAALSSVVGYWCLFPLSAYAFDSSANNPNYTLKGLSLLVLGLFLLPIVLFCAVKVRLKVDDKIEEIQKKEPRGKTWVARELSINWPLVVPMIFTCVFYYLYFFHEGAFTKRNTPLWAPLVGAVVFYLVFRKKASSKQNGNVDERGEE